MIKPILQEKKLAATLDTLRFLAESISTDEDSETSGADKLIMGILRNLLPPISQLFTYLSLTEPKCTESSAFIHDIMVPLFESSHTDRAALVHRCMLAAVDGRILPVHVSPELIGGEVPAKYIQWRRQDPSVSSDVAKWILESKFIEYLHDQCIRLSHGISDHVSIPQPDNCGILCTRAVSLMLDLFSASDALRAHGDKCGKPEPR